MAILELNIYGQNDEILNNYRTEHVRWGLLMKALDLQEAYKSTDPADQFKALNDFAKEIFVGLTDDDLKNADGRDVVRVFDQVCRMAESIKGPRKNA